MTERDTIERMSADDLEAVVDKDRLEDVLAMLDGISRLPLIYDPKKQKAIREAYRARKE